MASRAQDEPAPRSHGGSGPREEHEVRFAQGLPLADAAEIALEDYARELLSASRAEALRDASTLAVQGVRVIGAKVPPAPEVLRDIEDFAHGLAQRSSAGPGLGWS